MDSLDEARPACLLRQHEELIAASAISGNVAAARHEAEASGPIFPLHTPEPSGKCSCGKDTCRDVGKHPRTKNGLNDATQKQAQIERWWQQWPTANIGLATGKASGRFVIDMDPR